MILHDTQTQPISGHSWRTTLKGIFNHEQNCDQCERSHILKKKISQVCDCMLMVYNHGLYNQWIWKPGTLKENDWKIGEEDICGKDLCRDVFKWVDGKKVVSPVNAHQKLTSTKEEFSNQVNRMNDPILWICSPFNPWGIPVIVQCDHEQNGHGNSKIIPFIIVFKDTL